MLLYVCIRDERCFAWSADQLAWLGDERLLIINPIICAEVSNGFERIEDLDDALPSNLLRRDDLPYGAAFLAGKAS